MGDLTCSRHIFALGFEPVSRWLFLARLLNGRNGIGKITVVADIPRTS
jgi:hypothetical protein